MISQGVPKALLTLAPPRAALTVSASVFLRRNPVFAADLFARASVLAAGLVFWSWPLVLIGTSLLVWPYRRWRTLTRVMFNGSPAAAKVVALEPPLVAFMADYSKNYSGTEPVLVVSPANLRFERSRPDRGDRIAFVALAVGGTESRADRFECHSVSSVCEVKDVIDNIMAEIPEWLWDDLDEALLGMPNVFAPGEYPLDAPLEAAKL